MPNSLAYFFGGPLSSLLLLPNNNVGGGWSSSIFFIIVSLFVDKVVDGCSPSYVQQDVHSRVKPSYFRSAPPLSSKSPDITPGESRWVKFAESWLGPQDFYAYEGGGLSVVSDPRAFDCTFTIRNKCCWHNVGNKADELDWAVANRTVPVSVVDRVFSANYAPSYIVHPLSRYKICPDKTTTSTVVIPSDAPFLLTGSPRTYQCRFAVLKCVKTKIGIWEESRLLFLLYSVLDTVLGCCLVAWLFRYVGGAMTFQINDDFESELAEYLSYRLDNFILWLQTLLDWLLSNPAGLKLNKPLNQTLNSFFSYHIYLWRTYITFLRPTLEYVIKWIPYTSAVGLSFTVSILVDLVGLLTLHIYCFHVYATRLYQLQMAALISLWRLFRGKKWNPLRQRVDSAQFDSEQLFLGTLLFTILLFLLPTTLVYFSVFSALRLFVFSIQSLVVKCGSIAELLSWAVSRRSPTRGKTTGILEDQNDDELKTDSSSCYYVLIKDALLGRVM